MASNEAAATASMQTSDHDGVLVAVVSGELDMVSVDGIGTSLFGHLSEHPAGLIVDLAVDFMGSSALSMLLELYGRSQREGVGFAIVATQPAAVRPMTASALSQVLPLTDSVEGAMKLIREELKSGDKPA
ncbi:STAS domain-containing protein [Lentzea sp. NPDC051208]|uniref:STAS domain-containing protein n=1 Tax=Lentzea sp. NPDC051208 TaxID=3154642 RepID=UPI0034137FA3